MAEQRLHRSPDEEEIAAQLGLSIEEYHEWLVDFAGLNLGSLESATPDDEDNRDLLKYISDDEESWPSRLLERSELQRLLAEAIAKMPDIEKTVLSLYYHEELTLREISKIVHLHESRISQLKSQAILRLRVLYGKALACARGDCRSVTGPQRDAIKNWFFEALAARMISVFESMTGERPAIQWELSRHPPAALAPAVCVGVNASTADPFGITRRFGSARPKSIGPKPANNSARGRHPGGR